MTVAEAYDRRAELEGREVTVSGIFVAGREVTCLDSEDGELRIDLERPGLLDDCFGEIPVLVGGPFYYFDPAEVTGVLEGSGDALRLRDLRMLAVHRDDAAYTLRW